MNTLLELSFCDADGFKTHHDVVLTGTVQPELIERARDNLIDGEFILLTQSCLPTYWIYDHEGEIDHCRIRIKGLESGVDAQPSTTDEAPNHNIDAHSVFEAIANADWDELKESRELNIGIF